MRLQRLDLSGFKSFPDRAQLSFEEGVTAIVGPNGCGKSNLVDAITWVLGEQSARSLRGERMEDVIFSGSAARRPTAAAEVRLVLAGVTAVAGPGNGSGNSNGGDAEHAPGTGASGNGHDPTALTPDVAGAGSGNDPSPRLARDIEVSRRLYRSGESEYLIDGEICRLRDVQDLLMDAGMGTKGYAVIEQGKIGQILSARATERRLLIEEAAGVTKYKSRRRAAELKLQAAQQNLTRIDDIVYEVEKQRGALRRQAAKARRYRRLRDELRRWEKVLFARRHRALSQAIEAARARLGDATSREAAAAAALAEIDVTVERLRIEVTEADGRAIVARDAAHARELEIERLRQQIEFDRQQAQDLAAAAAEIVAEIEALEARREPGRQALEAGRDAAERAGVGREAAAQRLGQAEAAHAAAQSQVEGLEGDVEAARSEVFAAVNAAATLQHAIDHASVARQRIATELAKLDVESRDLTVEQERTAAEQAAAGAALQEAQAALEATGAIRADREAALAAARIARDQHARDLRACEQSLAGRLARLRSLEELDASRADYGDASRLLLADADAGVAHLGSVADHLEVDRRYERAVEACLGDLLQYVVVADAATATHGLSVLADRGAGRCGFLIADQTAATPATPEGGAPGRVVPLGDVVRVQGPAAEAVRRAIAGAWVAESFEQAAAAARMTAESIATLAGEVFRGPHLVTGGRRAEARGILAARREIKDLRDLVAAGESAVARLGEELATLDASSAQTEAAIAACVADQHRHEKAIVGFEMELRRTAEELDRARRKFELIALERRQAEDERAATDAREAEARASIERIMHEQKQADERFTTVQRRLFDVRTTVSEQADRMAEARAAHATMVERATASAADVQRLADAVAELEARLDRRRDDLCSTEGRRRDLATAVAASTTRLDESARTFERLRAEVREAEETVERLRGRFDAEEAQVRDARGRLDDVRAIVGQLEVQCATAESDLSHLASSCLDTVQTALEEVVAEVARLEEAGEITPDTVGLEGDEDADEAGEVAEGEAGGAEPAAPRVLSAEEAVAALRARIDRLGPVNMMAIEQFDELETRHAFLTSQRSDLVDSIASTNEAIRRIDRTTRERFREAFDAINVHFQQTFVTLFGGGQAGLLMLDEHDLLETGIDIIAQPPGKRLQNVQLLSGGEKALTAMALMFAIFQYRPSPFCLLDEIDAPLDDANIGRFVEMLRGMQARTQFILVTHNRKTMEIADRLYGVTMEEPGVSKLISVRLN